MKNILFIGAFLLSAFFSVAQPAILQHTSNCYTPQIILFSASGTKYLEQRTWDTLNFYNTNYTFWKRIILPPVPGCSTCPAHSSYAISDHLFNTDDSVELIVTNVVGSSAHYLTRIISESGTVLQIVDSAADGGIHYVDGNYMLITTQGYGSFGSMDSSRYYQLPGSLPCGHCGGTLGMENMPAGRARGAASSSPAPNPSGAEVKIYYQLPDGSSQGTINLYNSNGQHLKSFTVTNSFPYIILDNSDLPNGVYYYNLSGNGFAPTSNKMVIVR